MKNSQQIILAAAALATTALAQYEIDPDSVSNTTKIDWCNQQEAECPLICAQTPANSSATDANNCDPVSLTYACVCSNGLSPNISEYSQTLPYFICQEWGNQCVSNCGQDHTCQAACRDDHPCGALHPAQVNSSTLTTSTATASGSAATLSASTTAAFTGFGADGASTTAPGPSNTAATSSPHSGAASLRAVQGWALSAGQTFGTMGVLGALFGGFALML